MQKPCKIKAPKPKYIVVPVKSQNEANDRAHDYVRDHNAVRVYEFPGGSTTVYATSVALTSSPGLNEAQMTAFLRAVDMFVQAAGLAVNAVCDSDPRGIALLEMVAGTVRGLLADPEPDDESSLAELVAPEDAPNKIILPEGIMGCGHSVTAVVSSGEGTSFCGECEIAARIAAEGEKNEPATSETE